LAGIELESEEEGERGEEGGRKSGEGGKDY